MNNNEIPLDEVFEFAEKICDIYHENGLSPSEAEAKILDPYEYATMAWLGTEDPSTAWLRPEVKEVVVASVRKFSEQAAANN